MIPVKRLSFKEQGGEDGEHHERDDFLYYLQLDKRERSAVPCEPHPIRRYLKRIFSEGDAPREKDDEVQGPV